MHAYQCVDAVLTYGAHASPEALGDAGVAASVDPQKREGIFDQREGSTIGIPKE